MTQTAPDNFTIPVPQNYTMTLPPPTADPAASVQHMVRQAQEVPIPMPSDGLITLPGGWRDPSGLIRRTAEVRELSGADEEALSRSTAKGGQFNPLRFVQLVEERGLTSIDGVPADQAMRDSLLIGDADAIRLAIRIATYGPDYPTELVCPECGVRSKVAFELDKDIPMRTLPDPENLWRTIPLRGDGRTATVRLVTSLDQSIALSDPQRTGAEVDTVLMARVVQEIDGVPVTGESSLRHASAGDRRAISKYLTETQPGPQLGEVKGTCPACSAEVETPLSLPALFLL